MNDISDFAVPSTIDCRECQVSIPLAVTAEVAAGRDTTIQLVANIPAVTRAMVDHTLDAHSRPDPAALGAYINERVTIALTGARVLVEEMLELVGLEPTDQPGQYRFPASFWSSIAAAPADLESPDA